MDIKEFIKHYAFVDNFQCKFLNTTMNAVLIWEQNLPNSRNFQGLAVRRVSKLLVKTLQCGSIC